MKIAVTGAKGRLGSELVHQGCTPLVCDITDPKQVSREVGRVGPDVIIHCAAYTDVDGCEANPLQAFLVNTRSVDIVRGAFTGKFVLLSTDFIFDGKRGPYLETARPSPLNWYGVSKWSAELLLEKSENNVIVRTTLLFGNKNKDDFVQRVLRSLTFQASSLSVAQDLYGNPTYVPHLAEAILRVVQTDFSGTLNLCGTDWLNRYEMAERVAKFLGRSTAHRIIASKYREIDPLFAPRPEKAGMRLDKARKLGLPLYSFEDGLRAMMSDLA